MCCIYFGSIFLGNCSDLPDFMNRFGAGLAAAEIERHSVRQLDDDPRCCGQLCANLTSFVNKQLSRNTFFRVKKECICIITARQRLPHGPEQPTVDRRPLQLPETAVTSYKAKYLVNTLTSIEELQRPVRVIVPPA